VKGKERERERGNLAIECVVQKVESRK
jgi:hypothetical protein